MHRVRAWLPLLSAANRGAKKVDEEQRAWVCKAMSKAATKSKPAKKTSKATAGKRGSTAKSKPAKSKPASKTRPARDPKVTSSKSDPRADTSRLAAALVALGYDEHVARREARGPDARRTAVRGAVLRLLWKLVIDEDARVGGEPRWIESWMRWPRSQDEPLDGVAAAIERVLASGADPDDLTDIVRAMQYDVVWNFCDLLDGEGVAELRERVPGLPEMSWRLYAVDEDDDGEAAPLWPIESLHESIGSFDPAGREGEPRKRT